MKTKKEDYTKLYNRAVSGEKVPCWIDNGFSFADKTKMMRDICELRKTKNGDVIFTSRGSGYGGVESYLNLEKNEELPYFISFCEKYNVEYVI